MTPALPQLGRHACALGVLLLAVLPVQGAWTPATDTPSVRNRHAMAFDAARGRLVMFGGTDNNFMFADTWEFDGTRWWRGAAAPAALAARYEHALAYDAGRAVVVLFGGGDDTTLMADTWEYDGVAWRPGPAAPAGLVPRYQHALAYDGTRQRVMMIGGTNGAVIYDDVWEYDGLAWRAGTPATAPFRRRDHRMTFDPARGRLVMFGGNVSPSGFSYPADVWEYDGISWIQGASGGPVGRDGHVLEFDPASSRVVLFGGFTLQGSNAQLLNDLWSYDGTAWVQGPAAPAQLAGAFFEGVYDTVRGRVVVQRVYDGNVVLYGGGHGDMWELASGSWQAWSGNPIGRRHPGMAYHEGLGQQVLFGGYDGTSTFDDTWIFDGTRWSRGPGAPAGLTGRQLPLVVYDAARGVVVLTGGVMFNGGTPKDVWEYDGTGWTAGVTAPAAFAYRWGAAIAYDRQRSRSVIFGGCCSSGPLDDTWEYDGAAWTQGPAAPAGLVGRYGHAMAYDALRGRTVMMGGDANLPTTYLDDTWEYDGNGWSPAPSFLGEARRFHAMAFAPSEGVVVSHGGSLRSCCAYASDETWTYDGTAWTLAGAAPFELTPRWGSAMAHDLARSVTLLFGGFGSLDQYENDTWELDAACPVITLVPGGLPDGSVGFAYAQTISAVGGAPPHTFSLTYGSLPPGLALAPAGSLSGTPTTTGTSYFRIKGTDTAGCLGFRNYTLTINNQGCPAISLAPPTLPAAFVTVPYGQTLTASGGLAPYTFAATQGALPPGLALASSGVISGVPATRGLWSFLVEVVDAQGCRGSRFYNLRVRVAADYVAGQGLGLPNPNRVRLFGAAGLATPVDFAAYGAGHYGVNVASDNVDGGSLAEIVTGPGPGAVLGPQVRAFTGTGAALAKVNFYAYGTLRYGVNVAGGDLDADGFAEIVTAPGPGAVFGPHVRGFDYDGISVAPMAKVSFYAFGTPRYGAHVAGGSPDGDAFDEIVAGAGPSAAFGPQVRGFDYDVTSVRPMPGLDFFALATAGYGVVVASANVDMEFRDEIVCAPGPGPSHPPRFVGFDYAGNAVAPMAGYDVTPYGTYYGGRVGLGPVRAEVIPRLELLTGPGHDPSAVALVNTFTYVSGTLLPSPPSFVAFPGGYGVNITAGILGQ